MPLTDVVRTVAPAEVLPDVREAYRRAYLRRRRHCHRRRIEPITSLADKPLNEIIVLEPAFRLVAHAEVHHVHMGLLRNLHLSPAHVFRMSLAVLPARILPIAVMRSGNPAALEDNRQTVAPPCGIFLFPVHIVACHSERIVTEAVALRNRGSKKLLRVRIRRVLPSVDGLCGEHPMIVHNKRNVREQACI